MGEGRFRRALHRLVVSDEERASEDLIENAAREGATTVRRCGLGQQVCVAGEVRSVQVDTRGGSPVLEADVYDGTGTVTIVFLGRRSVAGLTAGRRVTARGRLTTTDGRPTIFNPSYELLAGDPAGR